MMKKPDRYVITGLDKAGVSIPVLARVKCENNSGSFESIFPIEAVHGYARNQREEGFVVNVDCYMKCRKRHKVGGQNISLL